MNLCKRVYLDAVEKNEEQSLDFQDHSLNLSTRQEASGGARALPFEILRSPGFAYSVKFIVKDYKGERFSSF
jgi:hypothetical protein